MEEEVPAPREGEYVDLNTTCPGLLSSVCDNASNGFFLLANRTLLVKPKAAPAPQDVNPFPWLGDWTLPSSCETRGSSILHSAAIFIWSFSYKFYIL